jgi:hypothetical protein
VSTVAAIVAVIALLATYLTWTAERIDRLNLRVERADASLDAQLVRRSAAAEAFAAAPAVAPLLPERQLVDLRAVAAEARASEAHAGAGDRWATENALTVRVLEAVLALRHAGGAAATADVVADLAAASRRVDLARSFYNQAVRDAREHRGRLAPRLLRLAGRAALPPFVDMDDTTLPEVAEQPSSRADLP